MISPKMVQGSVMALGGWNRGVHWNSLGTARSGACTEIVDVWTKSHSCHPRGSGVSAFEWHREPPENCEFR